MVFLFSASFLDAAEIVQSEKSNSTAAKNLCPEIISSWVTEDHHSSLGGLLKSAHSQCQGYLENKYLKNTNPQELGKSFHELFSDLQITKNKDLQPIIMDACQTQVQSSTKSATDQKQNELLSKYYYTQMRLRHGQQAALSSLATLGASLGKKDWYESTKCAQASSTETQKICQQLYQSCPIKADIKTLVARQKKILEEVSPFEAEKSKLQSWIDSTRIGTPEQRQSWVARLSVIETYLQSQYRKIPWIHGTVYKKEYSCHHTRAGTKIGCEDSLLENAILKQLKEDYIQLGKQYRHMTEAQLCLDSKAPSSFCSQKKLIELLDLTPPFTFETSLNKNKQKANAALDHQECLYDAMKNKTETEAVLSDSAVDILELAATGVTGGVALGVSTLVRKGKIAEKLASKIIYRSIQGYRAANIVMDATSLVRGVGDTIKECSRQDSLALKTNDKACDSHGLFASSSAEDTFTDCLKTALMNSIQFPLIGVNAVAMKHEGQKMMTQTKVDNLVENSLKGKHNPTEVSKLSEDSKRDYIRKIVPNAFIGLIEKDAAKKFEAIDKAHQVGMKEGRGFRQSKNDPNAYTKNDLRKKTKILREAGFTKEETDLLLRSGVAGEVAESLPKVLAGMKMEGRYLVPLNDNEIVGLSQEQLELHNAMINFEKKYQVRFSYSPQKTESHEARRYIISDKELQNPHSLALKIKKLDQRMEEFAADDLHKVEDSMLHELGILKNQRGFGTHINVAISSDLSDYHEALKAKKDPKKHIKDLKLSITYFIKQNQLNEDRAFSLVTKNLTEFFKKRPGLFEEIKKRGDFTLLYPNDKIGRYVMQMQHSLNEDTAYIQKLEVLKSSPDLKTFLYKNGVLKQRIETSDVQFLENRWQEILSEGRFNSDESDLAQDVDRLIEKYPYSGPKLVKDFNKKIEKLEKKLGTSIQDRLQYPKKKLTLDKKKQVKTPHPFLEEKAAAVSLLADNPALLELPLTKLNGKKLSKNKKLLLEKWWHDIAINGYIPVENKNFMELSHKTLFEGFDTWTSFESMLNEQISHYNRLTTSPRKLPSTREIVQSINPRLYRSHIRSEILKKQHQFFSKPIGEIFNQQQKEWLENYWKKLMDYESHQRIDVDEPIFNNLPTQLPPFFKDKKRELAIQFINAKTQDLKDRFQIHVHNEIGGEHVSNKLNASELRQYIGTDLAATNTGSSTKMALDAANPHFLEHVPRVSMEGSTLAKLKELADERAKLIEQWIQLPEVFQQRKRSFDDFINAKFGDQKSEIEEYFEITSSYTLKQKEPKYHEHCFKKLTDGIRVFLKEKEKNSSAKLSDHIKCNIFGKDINQETCAFFKNNQRQGHPDVCSILLDNIDNYSQFESIMKSKLLEIGSRRLDKIKDVIETQNTDDLKKIINDFVLVKLDTMGTQIRTNDKPIKDFYKFIPQTTFNKLRKDTFGGGEQVLELILERADKTTSMWEKGQFDHFYAKAIEEQQHSPKVRYRIDPNNKFIPLSDDGSHNYDFELPTNWKPIGYTKFADPRYESGRSLTVRISIGEGALKTNATIYLCAKLPCPPFANKVEKKLWEISSLFPDCGANVYELPDIKSLLDVNMTAESLREVKTVRCK